MGRGVGGGITHPRLQHLVKWLWKRVWDFSALGGGPTSSVSRRVVKLTVSHYYSVPLPEAMGTKPCLVHDSKHCEWVGCWWVWHAQWL